jgi:hypothetical protein
MKLSITHQEFYSRGELLLRSFFGILYIMLPHLFVLIFIQLWSTILQFISFWIILFTGRYPQSFFEFQVGMLRWNVRLNARLFNLVDGYPAFGINATDELTSLEVEYPEQVSRGTTLLKAFFGIFYVLLPHGFILYFRTLWGLVLNFLGFWAVLFTGEYPKTWHRFQVENIRWSTRVNLYMMFMDDKYPPFTGKE